MSFPVDHIADEAGLDAPVPPSLCAAPDYLRKLADWFDQYDDAHGNIERTVQRDLRAWADQIETLCHA